MNQLKEISCFDGRKKLVIEAQFEVPESFPPWDQIRELTMKDHKDRIYVYRLMEVRSETGVLDDSISCEDLSIDLNDIREIFMMLTDEQRNFVMHIYYVFKNNKKNAGIGNEDEENPKIILLGAAGTGKSTVINLIEKIITWEENKTSETPDKIKVLKCAFTGKAASNIEGVTLNHMFSIPIYKTRNLNKKRLNSRKALLEDCVVFICDEISMVGERLLKSVNMRLQQIFDNEKLYGDRYALLVGDLYQIDPVRQKPVYPKSELWTCCDFYELTKIIRQEDPKLINALNNFRDAKMTEDDIDLLKSREINDVDLVPDSVIHLFYLNKDVDEFNEKKLNKSNAKEEIVNAIDDSEKWQPSHLRVKLGIRYMITQNMNVGDGLANGITGVVKGFDYDENGRVVAVWMDFSSNVIGKKTRADYFKENTKLGFEKWVPICQSKVEVKLKTNPSIKKVFHNMFPLRAAEAITVHKSQGQTYSEGVCIHITTYAYDKLRTDKSLQYVALTRVKRLEDLYIMGTFNYSSKNSEKFQNTTIELNRLRKEKKLKLAFETFNDKTGDVIVYLNTGMTFKEHYEFITTDKWYGNASLLIFTKTNTTDADNTKIPNFEIALAAGGILCYKAASKSVEVVASIINNDNKLCLILFLYEKYLYILTGDKGNSNDDNFKQMIDSLISQYIKDEEFLFFANNFDPNVAASTINARFKKHIETHENGQRDLAFSRNFGIPQDCFGLYEYIPSSHQPIYVKLVPKSK